MYISKLIVCQVLVLLCIESIILLVADDQKVGRLARQTALSKNSCCGSVTGHWGASNCERPGAGGGDRHAGGHRAEAGQGLGQSSWSTLGKGATTITVS